jgi:glycosyltransferase involved in cell wall biosynthesis
MMATFAAPFLPRTDIVVSTSPQFFCGVAGYTVSRIKRRPWVLEIRDLWPETILSVGAMREGLLTHSLEKAANWAYRTADGVIALTDAFREHIVQRGASQNRVSVIKNGVDLSAFVRPTSGGTRRRALGFEDKFVAAYVGTHGVCHGLETILEAAKHLEHRSDITFLMVGGGAEREKLVALKESYGLSNVVMLDQQPKSAMPEILGSINASLILLKRDDLFKTVIPSKMFEAMAMRLPIVLGVEGESRALLHEAGAGIAITPESAVELADAVIRLAEDRSLASAFGERGRAHVEARFSRQSLAARYLQVLKTIALDKGLVQTNSPGAPTMPES